MKLTFFNTENVPADSGAWRSLCDRTRKPALLHSTQRSIYKCQLRKFTKYLPRRLEWTGWAGQAGGSGRDSHTKEACTSESNPGRGADVDTQMGKSKPQGLASCGELTSNGTARKVSLTPAFLPYPGTFAHTQTWGSFTGIKYPDEVMAKYREIFGGCGGHTCGGQRTTLGG